MEIGTNPVGAVIPPRKQGDGDPPKVENKQIKPEGEQGQIDSLTIKDNITDETKTSKFEYKDNKVVSKTIHYPDGSTSVSKFTPQGDSFVRTVDGEKVFKYVPKEAQALQALAEKLPDKKNLISTLFKKIIHSAI